MCFLSRVAVASDSVSYNWQVGFGISPLSGLNLFVGYHNFDSSYRLLRYFGARADFATSEPLKYLIKSAIGAYMDNGHDVGAGVKIDNGKFDACHSALFIDFYPFVKGWRLSTGFV